MKEEEVRVNESRRTYIWYQECDFCTKHQVKDLPIQYILFLPWNGQKQKACRDGIVVVAFFPTLPKIIDTPASKSCE